MSYRRRAVLDPLDLRHATTWVALYRETWNLIDRGGAGQLGVALLPDQLNKQSEESHGEQYRQQIGDRNFIPDAV